MLYRLLRKLGLLGLAFALLVAACGEFGPQEAVGDPVDPGDIDPEISGVEDLAQRLEAVGAEVELGETVEVPYFEAEGRVLEVDDAEIEVFEFPSEEARMAASSQITPEGQPSPEANVEWAALPHFWAAGRVIVLYVGEDEVVLDRLGDALGAPITQNASSEGGTYPEAVNKAIIAVAEQYDIPLENIGVVTYEAVEWPDACLGLEQAGQACAEVITPGYHVVLIGNGVEYEVRTDQTGDLVAITG